MSSSEHGFNFLSHIPVVKEYPYHVSGSVLVAVFLVFGALIAKSQLKRTLALASEPLVPDRKLTIKNIFEISAEKLFQMTESLIGEKNAPKFFPVMGALFVFIFVSNILGLIPGFLPPTDNLNTTLALGVFVFLYYNYVGFMEHGIGYLKHFFGPVAWLAPLMFIIEFASHFFRPISLAFRLRGNIMGDHVVLTIFSDLVAYGLPIVFYGMGVFVSFVQAFVFCLLTLVYISLSTSHDH